MTADADPRTRVTELLSTFEGAAGEEAARRLMPLVYPELRRLAGGLMRGERRHHPLQATALVHEVYLKLVDQRRVDWRGRTHFFAVGAQLMRRLLVDHARHEGRAKRGGGWQRVTLGGDASGDATELTPEELLSLDRALERLAELDPRQAQLVELRFFGGLTMTEAAEALGVSKRTAEGDWTHARAWLRRELQGPPR